MITGKQFIGYELSAQGKRSFQALNPTTGEHLAEKFSESTAEEINQAVIKAEQAFKIYRKTSPQAKADFLEGIGQELLNSGDVLIRRCQEETGLPEGRLIGERTRTINQLNLFAQLIREGSWVNARIDTAIPNRKPAPMPDLRQIQIALGPVGIFGASNFPFAFSVAGGDTASALAAGCSVVVKGHPAHPGTSELTAHAILKAARSAGMPDGIFSMLQGAGPDVGKKIVIHPLIKAVGFTGSFKGGKALYDLAAGRKEPIPLYAEMGSINPVFILPEALKIRAESIANGLVGSITLGAGQFCTNPGLVITVNSAESNRFMQMVGERLSETVADAMLSPNIKRSYDEQVKKFMEVTAITEIAKGMEGEVRYDGIPHILSTTADSFFNHSILSEEVFGPFSLIVSAKNGNELVRIAKVLDGQLTATIHGTEEDLKEHAELVDILERKVGRVILNGFPTGVEVCHSMVHGGPYPATTNASITSVGSLAIYRFTRPVCYQGFEEGMLPDELKDTNTLRIYRMVNGRLTQDDIRGG